MKEINMNMNIVILTNVMRQTVVEHIIQELFVVDHCCDAPDVMNLTFGVCQGHIGSADVN